MKSKVVSTVGLAGQIAEKNRCALQHAQQHDRLPGILPVDFAAHFRHPVGDLFPA